VSLKIIIISYKPCTYTGWLLPT